jgi:hypothetical protein
MAIFSTVIKLLLSLCQLVLSNVDSFIQTLDIPQNKCSTFDWFKFVLWSWFAKIHNGRLLVLRIVILCMQSFVLILSLT